MNPARLIALRLVRDDIPTPAPTSPARGPAGGSVPPPSASASQPVAEPDGPVLASGPTGGDLINPGASHETVSDATSRGENLGPSKDGSFCVAGGPSGRRHLPRHFLKTPEHRVAGMSPASPAGTSGTYTSSGLVGRLSAIPRSEAGGGIHPDRIREQWVRDEERNAR